MLAWPVAKWLFLFFEVCCVLRAAEQVSFSCFCDFFIFLTENDGLDNYYVNKRVIVGVY